MLVTYQFIDLSDGFKKEKDWSAQVAAWHIERRGKGRGTLLSPLIPWFFKRVAPCFLNSSVTR